jgi:hypothetical protein
MTLHSILADHSMVCTQLCHPMVRFRQRTPLCHHDQIILECDAVTTWQISDRQLRGAGVGAAAYFLLTGIIFATWALRVTAIKGGLDLSDGQFSIALLGLEAGAVLGLQLGGLIVPRVGSRRALTTSLVLFTCALVGPAFAPGLLLLATSLFAFAALNSVVDVAMNTQGLALQRLLGRPMLYRLHAMHILEVWPKSLMS